MIRHGSRGPVATSNVCFDNYPGYNLSCPATQLLSTSFNLSNSQLPSPGRLFRNVNIDEWEGIPGNCPNGELLPVGYEQQKANGRHLRDAYVGASTLFSPNIDFPDDSDIYVFSSDSERCLASGREALNSMFPATSATGTANLVNMHTVGSNVELLSGSSCPKFAHMLDDNGLFSLYSPSPCDAKAAAAEKVFQEARATTPFKPASGPTTASSILDIMTFDCTMVGACNGLSMPPGFGTSTDVQKIYDAAASVVSCYYQQPEVYRLALGEMLPQMASGIRAFTAPSQGNPPRKFVLWSGHDITLLPFLGAIHALPDGEWPPYASLLGVELYKDNTGSYSVRVYYNGADVKIPECGGSSVCPADTFLQLLDAASVQPAECVRTDEPSSPSQSHTVEIALGCVAGATTIWAVVMTALYLRKPKPNNLSQALMNNM